MFTCVIQILYKNQNQNRMESNICVHNNNENLMN